MATITAKTLKSVLLTGKAGLLQSLQKLTLDPDYVPARLPEGMVVGIWGEAVVRLPDGTVRELKVGEMVRKGYVILTSQNGIVQLQVEGDRLARIPADRDLTEAPGAGLTGGEDGSLYGAERATRVIEIVSPNGFDFSAVPAESFLSAAPNADTALAAGLPRLGVNPVTVDEGAGHAVFTVQLSRASDTPTTLNLALGDGTAAGAGVDYGSTSPANLQVSLDNGVTWVDATSVTLPPGTTSVLVRTPITDDTLREPNETFTLTATVVSGNVNVTQPTGVATIVDNGDPVRVASITSPAVDEGKPLDFTVKLTSPSDTPLVLDVLPRSGTATLGVDTEAPQVSFDGGSTWVPITGTTVTVPPGTDTLIVRIPTVDDPFKEPAETLTLDVKAPADATPTTGTGTINPDAKDTTVGVAISGPAEVAENVGNASYTVTLSDKSDSTVTVQVKTADGAAKAGSDYTAVDQTLTFAPGQTTQTVLVPITNDTTFEGKEAYTIELAAPAGATVVPATASVTTTIADDTNKDTGENNDAPTLAVSSVNVPESAGFAVFNVTLSVASGVATTVSLALADGTATGGGVDYGVAAGGAGLLQVSSDGGKTWADATTATFAPSQTGVLVRTPLVVDKLDDSGETFTLTATRVSPADGTTNASATGTATIFDKPGLLIDDVNVNEGTGTATFTVTLTGAASTPVTVSYTSENGTATAGSDYTAVTGTLTFAPGELSKTISVPINDDTVYEGPETFRINLSGPSDNALIIDGLGLGTIQDDGTGTVPDGVTPTDDRPKASINDVIVNEAAGTATFTVTLVGSATTPVTIDFATADGTAKAGLDYTAVTGTVTFAPGETSKSITVPILNDAVYEGGETFTVNLLNPSRNAVVSKPLGQGTIMDDGSGTVPDGVSPDDDRPQITINDVLVNEASKSAVFTVTLSNPSDLPVTVKYSSVNGTAEAGFDYEAVLGTLTFAPGELTKTISVPLQNDTVYEGAETFQIVLTDPTNAKVTAAGTGVETTKDGTGVGTIVDDGTGGPHSPDTPPGTPLDDDKPAFSIGDVTVNEASKSAVFTVTLSNTAKMPVTVTYNTADGTAVQPGDYGTLTGTLTFAPGETSKTILIPIVNDNVFEGTETFTVNLTSPTNATIADGVGVGTIKDDGTDSPLSPDTPPGTPLDDDRPLVTILNRSVVENLAGRHAEFTLTLSNPSTTATTVSLALADGTAQGLGVDYGSTGSNNLQVSADGGTTWVDATTTTFAPGIVSVMVRTPLNNDKVIEPSEAFTLTATTTAGTTRTPTASGAGTILDDDVAPVALPDTGRADEDTPITGTVLTNDSDANGDPLTVTGFSIGGTPYTPGTTATIPGVGTITIAPTGVYTFTPLPNYEGPVPVVTYTVTDGANPVNGTLTLTINPVNDAPIIGASQVTVSEEGLTGGIADSTGSPADTTNSTTATTTLSITDPDSAAFTVTWASAPTDLYSQGKLVDSWTGLGTNHIIGKIDGENGTPVLDATINNNGTYTVTLLRSVSHSGAGEDIRTLNLGVNVVDSGGATATSQISVNVEDDSPAAVSSQVKAVRLQDTNLTITLDVSGSMDGVRLSNARQAIKNLIASYDEFGDVAIRLVVFSDTAEALGSGWMLPSDIPPLIDGLIADGRTNYDPAIALTKTAFETPGKLPSGQNIAYFISDGKPNEPAVGGMNDQERDDWRTFLNSHEMRAYAVGISDDVDLLSALQPIAWDGRGGGSPASAEVVADPANLSAVLQQTVPFPSGDLTAGGAIGAGGMVGADGGYIRSVTVNGVTYLWADSRANLISVAGGSGVYTFDTSTKVLTVGTSGATLSDGKVTGSRFIVDLDEGTYEYRVPTSMASDRIERMTYTLSDIDSANRTPFGDTQTGEVVVQVGTSSSVGITYIGDASRSESIFGGLGHDTLGGLAGNDTLSGSDGNDKLLGGRDADALTGGLGADVFAWTLSDQGSRGTPAVDTITDFDTRLPSAGGDIIDLRDLLSGETTGTLENYLEFSFAGSGSAASTTIHVSSTGAFAGGAYSAAAADQTIVLSGVDLRTSLGLGTTASDADIIGKLLTQGKLIVDP